MKAVLTAGQLATKDLSEHFGIKVKTGNGRIFVEVEFEDQEGASAGSSGFIFPEACPRPYLHAIEFEGVSMAVESKWSSHRNTFEDILL